MMSANISLATLSPSQKRKLPVPLAHQKQLPKAVSTSRKTPHDRSSSAHNNTVSDSDSLSAKTESGVCASANRPEDSAAAAKVNNKSTKTVSEHRTESVNHLMTLYRNYDSSSVDTDTDTDPDSDESTQSSHCVEDVVDVRLSDKTC